MHNVPRSVNLGDRTLAVSPVYAYSTHMAIAASDNLSLRAFLVYICALGLPPFSKDIFRESTCTSDVGQVAFAENVHDLICDEEGLVLQSRVSRQGIHKFAQCGEVPEESPCCQ